MELGRQLIQVWGRHCKRRVVEKSTIVGLCTGGRTCPSLRMHPASPGFFG